MTPDEIQDSPCTHHGVDNGDYYGTSNPPQETDWNYPFCPQCGAELMTLDEIQRERELEEKARNALLNAYNDIMKPPLRTELMTGATDDPR